MREGFLLEDGLIPLVRLCLEIVVWITLLTLLQAVLSVMIARLVLAALHAGGPSMRLKVRAMQLPSTVLATLCDALLISAASGILGSVLL